jgi:hypothetical protein
LKTPAPGRLLQCGWVDRLPTAVNGTGAIVQQNSYRPRHVHSALSGFQAGLADQSQARRLQDDHVHRQR